jgi:hypothetical protein
LSGVLHALVEAVDECTQEGVHAADDPAVRLLVWWISDTLVYAHESDMMPEYESFRDLKELGTMLRTRTKEAMVERDNQSFGSVAGVDMKCRAIVGQMAYVAHTDIISKWFGDMYEKLAGQCKEKVAAEA